MSTKRQADSIASKGRYGDTELVHMAPWEVDYLRSLSPTGDLTVNPDTGKPEAFIFSLLLPMILPNLLAGGGIAAALGATGTALAAGALGGGLDSAIAGTDPLTGALMGGAFGALGGGNMFGDLFGKGASAAGQGATAAASGGLAQGAQGAAQGAAIAGAQSAAPALGSALNAGMGAKAATEGAGMLGGIGAFLKDNPMMAMAALPLLGGMGGGGKTKKEEEVDIPEKFPANGGLAAAYRPNPNMNNYGVQGQGNENEYYNFPGYRRFVQGGPVIGRNMYASQGPAPSMSEGGLMQGMQQPMQAPMQPSSPQGLGRMFAEGGPVDPMAQQAAPQADPAQGANDKQLVKDAMLALSGRSNDPQAAIQRFVQRFGQEALADLQKRVAALGIQPEASRPIQGPGDGMNDQIPATIEGQAPAALANDEHVISADVVSGLGNGSSQAGHGVLKEMANRVRMAKGGAVVQPKAINPQAVLPA